MATDIELLTPVAFGRILERLDQQDRNTLLREAETKGVAVSLAEELKKYNDAFHQVVQEHIDDDSGQFKAINDKLDILVVAKNEQSGGIKVLMWIAGGLGALTTLAVAWFTR